MWMAASAGEELAKPSPISPAPNKFWHASAKRRLGSDQLRRYRHFGAWAGFPNIRKVQTSLSWVMMSGRCSTKRNPLRGRIIPNQLLRYCVSFYVYFARLIRIVVRVNDYKPPARLERAAKTPHHCIVFPHFMVEIDHQDGVQLARRKMRVIFGA